jgi:molecular chaperone DnaK (HSP70)
MSVWKWFSGRGSDAPDTMPLIVEANSPALMARSQLIEAIGIETIGGVFTPIINAGQSIPFSITQMFSTAVHWQTEITLELYRGNSVTHVSYAHPLGTFKVVGIPRQPRGMPEIDVRFFTRDLDLLVEAKDRNGNKNIRMIRADESGSV